MCLIDMTAIERLNDGAAAIEDSMEFPKKVKYRITICSSNSINIAQRLESRD